MRRRGPGGGGPAAWTRARAPRRRETRIGRVEPLAAVTLGAGGVGGAEPRPGTGRGVLTPRRRRWRAGRRRAASYLRLARRDWGHRVEGLAGGSSGGALGVVGATVGGGVDPGRQADREQRRTATTHSAAGPAALGRAGAKGRLETRPPSREVREKQVLRLGRAERGRLAGTDRRGVSSSRREGQGTRRAAAEDGGSYRGRG